MRIVQLTLYQVRIPLRSKVEHASASRDSSDNIIAQCTLADGTQGWGEGVPREYVTGETPSGAFDQLARTPIADQLSPDCSKWLDVIGLCDRIRPAAVDNDPRGCHGNALRCAIELSVLDAFGRLFEQPISALIDSAGDFGPIYESRDWVRYSGAIVTSSPRRAVVSAIKMRVYGFGHCKVKVGMSEVDDISRLRKARRWLGRAMDIRIDANEAWFADEAVARVEPLLPFGISSVEQPVPHEQVESLREFRKQLAVPIMLDESLTGMVDAQRAIEQQTCDLFNIRLSKCGGFISSLRLALLAQQNGLGYQLGCHPGESGILSAAGRQWASSIAKIRYLEGSYDRHLVTQSFTTDDITFGYGGWAPALKQPGLGVQVDTAAIKTLASRKQSISCT